MRAVVQRVSRAAVSVDDRVVGSIGPGFLVLVGAAVDDGPEDATALADKVATLRVFSDGEGKMNRSVLDAGGEVLVVSQFTLQADVRRGRRPSFTRAAPPERAAPLVELVSRRLTEAGLDVAVGEFGAQMEVALVNDGPVTIIVETRGGKVVSYPAPAPSTNA